MKILNNIIPLSPIPQNGQTHPNNSSDFVDELFEYLTVLWKGKKRKRKEKQKFTLGAYN